MRDHDEVGCRVLAVLISIVLFAACGEAVCDCAATNPDLILETGGMTGVATARACVVGGPCADAEVRASDSALWFSFGAEDLDERLEANLGVVSVEFFSEDESRTWIAALSVTKTESCCGDYWQTPATSP